jgi:hypothetical protein
MCRSVKYAEESREACFTGSRFLIKGPDR